MTWDDDLVQHLNKHGYVRAGTTDGLFKHITRDISFTLVVDDFGIKYVNDADVLHLIKIMREKYTFKVDFHAKQYIGIDLEWDYQKRELITSMKGYVEQALKELEHVLTSNRHYGAPSTVRTPQFGAKIQYVYDDDGVPIEEVRIRKIQRAIGKFLYYARAIDVTMHQRPPPTCCFKTCNFSCNQL